MATFSDYAKKAWKAFDHTSNAVLGGLIGLVTGPFIGAGRLGKTGYEEGKVNDETNTQWISGGTGVDVNSTSKEVAGARSGIAALFGGLAGFAGGAIWGAVQGMRIGFTSGAFNVPKGLAKGTDGLKMRAPVQEAVVEANKTGNPVNWVKSTASSNKASVSLLNNKKQGNSDFNDRSMARNGAFAAATQQQESVQANKQENTRGTPILTRSPK